MSAVNIIIGIALTAMFCGVIIAWWHGHRDLFSVLFVACIATLAIAIGNPRGGQHADQKTRPVSAVQPPAAPARAPMTSGPTGSPAPPAVGQFYAGYP